MATSKLPLRSFVEQNIVPQSTRIRDGHGTRANRGGDAGVQLAAQRFDAILKKADRSAE